MLNLPTRIAPWHQAYSSTFRINFPKVRALLIIGTFAIMVGILSALSLPLAFGVAAGLLICSVIIITGNKFYFLWLMFVFLGYVFLSRGFAYIGFNPLYIGEATLGLGFLVLGLALFSRRLVIVNWKRLFTLPVLLIMAYIGINSLQTIPYFAEYQFDTLRDAVIFGYALYTILILLLVPRIFLDTFFRLYKFMIPYFLIASFVFFLISRTDALSFIRLPGAPISLIATKPSDSGVHLAGIAAFLLLRLDKYFERPFSRAQLWIFWGLWLVGVLFQGTVTRAVLVTVAASCGLVFLIRPMSTRWQTPVIILIMTIWFILVTNLYSTLQFTIGDNRNVSAEQITNNIVSIFASNDESGDSNGGIQETKEWRLVWWNKIIDYTFNGNFFWTGKGYGINLANSDGFQVTSDESLRSPHNGHLMILARGGVPGFIAWCLVLLAFVVIFVTVVIRNRVLNSRKAKFTLWFFIYLVAFNIMGSFDVFLESPFGGVPMWILVGFALIYIRQDESTASTLIS